MKALNEPVLVLNKSWNAIRVRTVKKILGMVFRERAAIVDKVDFFVYNWESWVELPIRKEDDSIKTTSGPIRLPEVVVLTVYNKIPQYDVKLSKKNVYIRDGYRCQYSGDILDKKEADLDHILPVSRGGKTTWNNLALCSKKINRYKNDRTPEEAGLKLIREPFKPTSRDLIIDPKGAYKESWFNFIKRK